MASAAPAPASHDLLVFLPGFMIAPAAYTTLLAPLADRGVDVLTPALYRRSPATMLGRVSCDQEAQAAAQRISEVHTSRRPDRVWLAGHSRGGQAAWRCANRFAEQGEDLLAGLILIDPVDGSSRTPSAPDATARPAVFTIPTLIIGAGLGGRCAPTPVNHDQFARATPAAAHVVVEQLGHADILDGRSRALGRRLCGGAEYPDPGRTTVSELMTRFLRSDVAETEPPLTASVVWRRLPGPHST